MKTTNYSSWVVQTRALQIQDGGWPTSSKMSKNRHTAWPIAAKFGAVTHFDPLIAFPPLKFGHLKIQDGGWTAAILKN